jgi:hypothetical protein
MAIEDKDDTRTIIVNGLSVLIRSSLASLEGESTAPGPDPDRMDATIKLHRERVATLRRLREEFENEMARCAVY